MRSAGVASSGRAAEPAEFGRIDRGAGARVHDASRTAIWRVVERMNRCIRSAMIFAEWGSDGLTSSTALVQRIGQPSRQFSRLLREELRSHAELLREWRERRLGHRSRRVFDADREREFL